MKDSPSCRSGKEEAAWGSENKVFELLPIQDSGLYQSCGGTLRVVDT